MNKAERSTKEGMMNERELPSIKDAIERIDGVVRDAGVEAFELDWCAVRFCMKEAADKIEELEAALPKWTLITDDPFSWPQKGTITLMRIPSIDGNGWARPWVQISPDTFYDACYTNNKVYWRPLCDLDYPPKGEG